MIKELFLIILVVPDSMSMLSPTVFDSDYPPPFHTTNLQPRFRTMVCVNLMIWEGDISRHLRDSIIWHLDKLHTNQ